MDSRPPTSGEITPERPKRARSTPTSREWPPPCESGTCRSTNQCICRKKARSVAIDYYECASLIHGADAPGMPDYNEMNSAAVDHELADIGEAVYDTADMLLEFEDCLTPPQRRKAAQEEWTQEHSASLLAAVAEHDCDDWTKIGVIVGQPGQECRRQWLLLDQARHRTTMPDYFVAKHKKSKAKPEPVPQHLCLAEDLCADISKINAFWANPTTERTDNCKDSPRSIDADIDLFCDEDPAVSVHGIRKVHWYGLPDNPPEWKSGERRKVPRTWEPCRYVNTKPEAREAVSFFHPTLSYEMCTASPPPLSFWD